MLNNLSKKFSNIFNRLTGKIITKEHLEKTIKDIKTALIEADVSISIIKEFIESISQEAEGRKVLKSIKPEQLIAEIVHSKMTEIFSRHQNGKNIKHAKKIMMVGLQGSGKTTTCAKIANYIENKKVLLVSTDVYRPAAIEQLSILATEINADFFSTELKDPVEIIKAAMEQFKAQGYDVIICDTAGRSYKDENMVEEMQKLYKVMSPDEVLLVLDAAIGQESSDLIKQFNEKIPITGSVISRVDSDAKGGVVFNIKYLLEKPIKFLGISEKVKDGLEEFEPESFASRILDMGDIMSLVKKAKTAFKEEEENIDDIKNFNLLAYEKYIKKMHKMGNVSGIASMLPGAKRIKEEDMQQMEKMMDKQRAILNSMNIREKKSKDGKLNASRKNRIVNGSGCSIQDLNFFLKQYLQMSKVMKMLAKNPKGIMQNIMGKMF